VFTLTVSLPDESWCTGLLRNVRWGKGRVECPRCNSYNIKKDGQYLSYQKYLCKQCKRWFNDKTGTVFHFTFAFEEMVFGYLPVLCTMAWMLSKRNIT
jgi:transposase-like protein